MTDRIDRAKRKRSSTNTIKNTIKNRERRSYDSARMHYSCSLKIVMYPTKLCVIWDTAKWHRSKEVSVQFAYTRAGRTATGFMHGSVIHPTKRQ